MNVLPELSFIQPAKQMRTESDVSVTLNINNGKKRASFTFRNEVWDILAPTTGRLTIAVFKNRIFFKEDDHGFKYSGANTKNRYIRVDIGDVIDDFIGDYEIKFDPFYELYYIERA